MIRGVRVLALAVAGCSASSSGSSTPETESAGSSSTGVVASGGSSTSTAQTSDAPNPTEADGSSGSGAGSDDPTGEPQPPADTPGCGLEFTGEVLDGVMTIRGEERNYIIEVPTDYDPDTPYPLIFGFHGDGGDGQAAQNGYRIFDHYDGQAIVVYPSGSGAGGSPGWDTGAGGSDIEFVIAIAQEVGEQMCFDLGRVHAFGFSRGGAMSHAVGCYRGDFFSGVGVASGWAPSTGLCQRPIAMFISHGDADDRVPYSSGTSARDAWITYNGCSEETVPSEREGCVLYQGCSGGAPLEWCTFSGGHSFDGGYAREAVELFKTL